MGLAAVHSAIIFKLLYDSLKGIIAEHVDDCLHACDTHIHKLTDKISNKFECGEKERDLVDFTWVQIETKDRELY